MDEEARNIFEESIKKEKAIIKEAKANGTWQMGLDSNRALFKELHEETKDKLKALNSTTKRAD